MAYSDLMLHWRAAQLGWGPTNAKFQPPSILFVQSLSAATASGLETKKRFQYNFTCQQAEIYSRYNLFIESSRATPTRSTRGLSTLIIDASSGTPICTHPACRHTYLQPCRAGLSSTLQDAMQGSGQESRLCCERRHVFKQGL